MIDEELYQQATDELNSDRRRPHLWARACALASDDHDEARYLYTNLRVEELIAERERAPARTSDARDDFDTGELELAPVSTSTTPVAPASFRSGTDGGLSAAGDDFGSLDLEPLDDGEARPSSVRTEARLDVEALDDIDLDVDELAAMNDMDRAPTDEDLALARGHEPLRNADETDLGEPVAARADDDRWLDDERPEPLSPHEPFDDTEDHSTGLDDTDAPPPSEDAGGAPERESPLARARRLGSLDDVGDDPGGESVSGAALAARRAFSPAPLQDYADSSDLDELLDDEDDEDDEAPIVDLDGRGGIWAVYETGSGRLKALRRGVSWMAMLLTLPWLLVRGLLGTAALYVLLWCVALGGALLTGLAWIDSGENAADTLANGGFPLLPAACIGFLAIAALGLIILPFFRANHWRESAWQRRGYALRGELRARNANEALHRVRSATLLHLGSD